MSTPCPCPPYTIEHITYRHGDKQETETGFETLAEAMEYADYLRRYGGRVWLNGIELNW